MAVPGVDEGDWDSGAVGAARSSAVGVVGQQQLEAMGHRGVPRPTPACVSVLDVLAEIQTAAVRIANEVLFVVPWQACVWRPAWSPQFDVRPWFADVGGVAAAGSGIHRRRDDPLAPWCERIIGATPDAAARLFGDVRSGQDLAGSCPWCEVDGPRCG